MKYASEIIDLLSAYPGREFKMRQLINHAAPRATLAEMPTLRCGIWRVLQLLEESGQVEIIRPEKNGGSAAYRWKTISSFAGKPSRKPSQFVRANAP